MMRLELSLVMPLNENASAYFEKAKKFRKKLEGLGRGMLQLQKKAENEKKERIATTKVAVKKRSRKWYEKYHWFFTSEGFLVVAGKDASSNETIVTKMMGLDDLYFHADIHGAAHTVLKVHNPGSADGNEAEGAAAGRGPKAPSEISKRQAAQFAAAFSSAWREKIPAIDVYSAQPGQVTKAAPTGEAIGMGAFMVYGKREWYKKTPLEFAIGYRLEGGKLALHSGPPAAVKANCDFFVGIKFGDDSKGDAAKKVMRIFSSRLKGSAEVSIEDIVLLLPSGGIAVVYPGG